MSGMVSNKKLLFLLADEQSRTYYVDSGVVKKSVMPIWLSRNPDGEKEITLQWSTNQKYFSTIRQFSNAVKFSEDGLQIITERMLKGAGSEEIMYLIILKSNPDKGINYYDLEYKSRLDFSKFNGDITSLTAAMNTLQDDVFAMVQANENTSYSIPCNSSNPDAIRILFDGTLLQDKFNYSIIAVASYHSDTSVIYAIPMAFLNNEGDNVGITNNSPNFAQLGGESVDTYVADPTNSNYIMSSSSPIKVTIKGTFSFIPHRITHPNYAMTLFFQTSLQTYLPPANQVLYDNGSGSGAPGWPDVVFVNDQVYTVTINCTINLAAGEKLFFFLRAFGPTGDPGFIEVQSTSLSIIFASENTPSLAYGLRPLDYGKQLVSLITNGKYTFDSKFLSANNRKIITSGSALRNFADAQIQGSFSNFFQSFCAAYNMGITVRNGVMYMEPVGDIYNSNQEILRLDNVSKASLTVAEPYIYSSAKFGYQKQTYNKRNGRYEYNCTHNVKFPINTVLNELNRVAPWRADSFGMEFIRTGYPNLDTTDDKGDKDVFTVMISDSVGQTDGNVSTAIAFNVETLILASPVIRSPFSNSVIYNSNPTITGVAQALKTITVYADGVIDGTTESDSDGNWSYQIQTALKSLSTFFNGVHVITAIASTDPLNLSGFSQPLSIIINTQVQSAFLITSPGNNDTLYNNLPLITGIAPSGKTITLEKDGASLGSAISNSSGIWQFQVTTALTDGSHVISASANELNDAPPVTIIVNKNVSSPLITSLYYNQIIYNNLPLIKGVAQAGVTVSVYLDGGGGPIISGVRGPLGTTIADANGDWSFQVASVYNDSGIEIDYIPDGLHIISTTPEPVNVLASISGYRLMRGSNKGPVMDYDAIKLDDQYIPVGVDPSGLPPTLGQFLHPETLYNIEETSPLRMQRAHDNMIGSFLKQQAGQQVLFNGAEVNANLVTKKDGIIFNEGAHVNVNDLSANLYLPFFLNFKTKVPDTFNDIMSSLNNDGYVTVIVKDTPIYCLPIGKMIMKPATDEAQDWQLLISGKTPLLSLLQLFSNGLPINIGKNMIYISDKNPLHFVKYNYTPPAGYHFSDIYDDWQKNRFPRWRVYQPDFYQPVQKGTDKIALQFISNGVGTLQIQMISITTGFSVGTFSFTPVGGSLVPLPNILQEVEIDPGAYPEDQYWFAIMADSAIVAISEKIWLKSDWPDTMLFEYGGSKNAVDFNFSTGIKPMIRIQSEWLPWSAESEVDNYEDDAGDFEMTRALALKMRVLQLGSENSLLADWAVLKMNIITLLSNLLIEGVHHTRDNNSKMEKEDLGKGIPEFLCKIELVLADNQNGATFDTPGDTVIYPVAYVLDATAFGHNEGVINVTAESN